MSDDLFKITEDNKKNIKGLKKLLIYGAVAFLLFVIGIVAFALFKNSSSTEDNILPPEVKKEPMFKQIPVEKKEITIEDNPLAGENVSNVNEVDNNTKTQEEQNKNMNTFNSVNTNQNTNPKENSIQTSNTNMKNVPSVQKTEEHKIKTVSVQHPKPVIHKSSTINKKVMKEKYYIQAAALLKNKKPDNKFLEIIKKDGFNYKIIETYTLIKNERVKITKILIGPFNSRADADKSLIKVKKFITKNAFIVKVK